jgi:hypothetical protein
MARLMAFALVPLMISPLPFYVSLDDVGQPRYVAEVHCHLVLGEMPLDDLGMARVEVDT